MCFSHCLKQKRNHGRGIRTNLWTYNFFIPNIDSPQANLLFNELRQQPLIVLSREHIQCYEQALSSSSSKMQDECKTEPRSYRTTNHNIVANIRVSTLHPIVHMQKNKIACIFKNGGTRQLGWKTNSLFHVKTYEVILYKLTFIDGKMCSRHIPLQWPRLLQGQCQPHLVCTLIDAASLQPSYQRRKTLPLSSRSHGLRKTKHNYLILEHQRKMKPKKGG